MTLEQIDTFRYRQQSILSSIYMLKVCIKNTRNVSNMFKFNNTNTRTSFASIVNFEHISHFILLLLVLNSNKYMLLGSENIYFQTTNLFSVTVKYIVLWVGKICWATCFYLCSPKIRLQKDNFSRQRLKKISRTPCMCIFICTRWFE